MKKLFFLILTVISINLFSCKKEVTLKPAPQQAVPTPVAKTQSAVKAVPYDYYQAIRVKSPHMQ